MVTMSHITHQNATIEDFPENSRESTRKRDPWAQMRSWVYGVWLDCSGLMAEWEVMISVSI